MTSMLGYLLPSSSPKSGLFLENSDKIRGEYCVTGESNDIGFMTCQIINDVFRVGRWYEFYLNKNFGQELRFCEESALDDAYIIGLTKCEVESIDFDDKFAVYASDPKSAFYVLTPQIIEYLVEMEKKYKGKIVFSFVEDRLYVCIKDRSRYFKHDIKKKINEENLTTVIEDLKVIEEIIIRLGLNTNKYNNEKEKENKKEKGKEDKVINIKKTTINSNDDENVMKEMNDMVLAGLEGMLKGMGIDFNDSDIEVEVNGKKYDSFEDAMSDMNENNE